MSNSDIELLKCEPLATTADVRKLQDDVQHLTSIVRELTATVNTLKNSKCKERGATTSAKTDEAEENDFLDVPLQGKSYQNEAVEMKGML